MGLPFQEKPSSGFKKTEAKEALLELGKSVKEGFAKSGEKMLGWFQEFFRKSKEKGLKASLIGPLVGLAALISALGEKTKEKTTGKKEGIKNKVISQARKAREKLKGKVEACPALPPIPAKVADAIPDNIRGTFEGIRRAVKLAKKNRITGDHCWNWTEKIYAMAGFHPRKRIRIYNSVPKYTKYKYYKPETGKGSYGLDKNGNYVRDKNGGYVRERMKTPDCGEHHFLTEKAKEKNPGTGRPRGRKGAMKLLAQTLTPGDHIFINNKNRYDFSGNHSEIFLGWVNRGRLYAKVAGYPGKGRPPYTSIRSLNACPVTWIAKPVPLKKSRPLVS